MKDHSECIRGFYVLSESWYGKNRTINQDFTDEIMIGFYHQEGGTTGEFAVRWSDVGGQSTPRLEVFSDAWDALTYFSDVLKQLALLDEQEPDVRTVADVLLACGVQDMTVRVNPNLSVEPGQ